MAIIETYNLSKYYGKQRGIENVNLSVEQGEIFGFIGPNGAGKSTTIRILLNLLFPTKGKATVFGLDCIKHSKTIKKKIGFIPSEVNYYERMTVEELFKYSARFYEKTCIKSIEELSHKFDLSLNKKIAELSLGNKKKVSIIQCFIHNPEVMIMDEATSGLDPLMQSHFFELIKQEKDKGKTVFYSSHVLNEVQQLCKRIAIIKGGQIINIEDIQELREKQLKKVELRYRQSLDESSFPLPGIHSLLIKRGKAEFFFSGDINELIRYLSKKELTNLVITEPTLEEIFMHYYE